MLNTSFPSTSADLGKMLSDETGTGSNVFATSPTFVTPVLGTPTSGDVRNCTAAIDGTAGVLSATDHISLTSLSGFASGAAPGFIAVGIPVIAFLSGLDIKTNAATDIFTVPASRTFVATSAFIICTAVTGGVAVTFTYAIRNSAATSMVAGGTATSSAPTVAKVWPIVPLIANSPLNNATAAQKVQANITTGFTTSTTVTGTVFVLGFYAA